MISVTHHYDNTKPDYYANALCSVYGHFISVLNSHIRRDGNAKLMSPIHTVHTHDTIKISVEAIDWVFGKGIDDERVLNVNKEVRL